MRKMRTVILILILGNLIYSCQNEGKKDNSIAGKWTIANITPEDSTNQQGIHLLTFIMAKNGFDYIEFSSNGQYMVLNEKDSVLTNSEYKISENGDEIIIKESGEDKHLKIVLEEKDKLKLRSSDGVTLDLKRKD